MADPTVCTLQLRTTRFPARCSSLRVCEFVTTHPMRGFCSPQAYFNQAGPDGVSMRSHLTEVIHRLLLSKDADALSKLESISLEVKAKHFDANQFRVFRVASRICLAL